MAFRSILPTVAGVMPWSRAMSGPDSLAARRNTMSRVRSSSSFSSVCSLSTSSGSNSGRSVLPGMNFRSVRDHTSLGHLVPSYLLASSARWDCSRTVSDRFEPT